MEQLNSNENSNSAAVNGIVISVNEVPDGTAETIFNDINSELEKITKCCKRFGSSKSYEHKLEHVHICNISASTQAKFDKLIEIHRGR